MKTLQVGELKSKFSEVLDYIRKGEEVVISFGKKKGKTCSYSALFKIQKGHK